MKITQIAQARADRAKRHARRAAAIYIGASIALALAMSAFDRAAAQTLTSIEPGQGVQLTNVRVIDGDTISAGGVNYRLAGIDAPEVSGAECLAERLLGERATAALRRLIDGADLVSVTPSGLDRYGRTLGQVWVDGHDAGALLLSVGLAGQWEGRRVDWCATGALS